MMTKSQITAVATVLESAKSYLDDLQTGIDGGYYDNTEKAAGEIAELSEAIELLENSNWVTGEMNDEA